MRGIHPDPKPNAPEARENWRVTSERLGEVYQRFEMIPGVGALLGAETPVFGPSNESINPSTISTSLWLKADAESYADNDAVGTANDQSGNARHLTQTTAAKKPTFKTNIQNGLPCYRFDGGDCLTRASFALSTFAIVTCFCASADGVLYEQSADASANDGVFLYTHQTTMVVRKSATLSGRNWVANWGSTNEPHVIIHFFSGTHRSQRLWCDGGLPPMGFTLAANDPGTGTTTDTLNVGARSDAGSLALTGDIFETVWIDPVPTWATALGVARYMALKWNVPY